MELSDAPSANNPLYALNLLFRSGRPSISSKVGSSIHRVRLASGFLLVAQSKATRRGGFSQSRASFRRVDPDYGDSAEEDHHSAAIPIKRG